MCLDAGAGIRSGHNRSRVLGVRRQHMCCQRSALPQPVVSGGELYPFKGPPLPLEAEPGVGHLAFKSDPIVVEQPLAECGIANYQRTWRLARLEQLCPENRPEALPRFGPFCVKGRMRQVVRPVVREKANELRHGVALAV